MHQVINEELYQHSLFIISFFVSYNNIISLLNHTPIFWIYFSTYNLNKIQLTYIFTTTMNNYININCIDNFQFLSIHISFFVY